MALNFDVVVPTKPLLAIVI